MPRLYIGSYIIDSADSSSSSTTSGVQLDLPADDPIRPVIQGNEYRWPIMMAQVTAASESALKTAVDAVVDAIRNCQGKTIKYEETNGTTLFEMASTLWPQAQGDVEVEPGQLTAYITFSFIGAQAGPVSGGAADEPGQIQPINWQYEVSGGGIAGMIATCVFGPTIVAGSITAGARQNAIAWINKLKTTSNYPAWLGTAFRQVDAVVEFDQKQNLASVAESSYDPAQVTIFFAELPASVAADSTFNSNVQRIEWSVAVNDRPPLNKRSNANAGFDITLNMNFTLKTEGNTAFNSSDTSLADADIYAKALAVANAVITLFQTVYASITLVKLGQPIINIDPGSGLCVVAVRYIGDTTIVEWQESALLSNVEQKVHSRATDGSDWKYEMEGGPIRTLAHQLRIVSIGSPVLYKPPSLGSDWDELQSDTEPKTEAAFSDGTVQFMTYGQKTWRYVNPGPGSNINQSVTGAWTLDSVPQKGVN